MRRFLDRLYTGSGVLAALCVFGIFALMLAQAFGRTGEERGGLWLERLGPRARRVMEIWALTVTALFIAYMLWAVSRFIYESWQFNEVAQGLIKVPIWIPQTSFLVGVVIFFIAVVDELVTVLRNQKPAYQLADEARRAAGDFSETV